MNPDLPGVRVIAYPRAGHPYVTAFYGALERAGVEVLPGQWSGSWLREHIDDRTWIHLNWPSQLYQLRSREAARWREVLRFCALVRLVRRLGGRIAWTAHNLYPHDEGHSRLPHSVARRWLVHHVDRVLVHGHAAGEIVRQEFGIPARKLIEIHHGHWIGRYPDDQTREAARVDLGVAPDEYVFLFFGLCRPYKNLEGLVEAFAAQPAGAQLLIVGRFLTDGYRGLVEARARAAPGVRLVPSHIPDESIQTYMKAADCVVLPYRDSLTSGAAMLALGFGRPVVAPAIGSLIDVIDQGSGLLYDAQAPGALARALVEARARQFDERRVLERARMFSYDDAAATFAGHLRRRTGGDAS